MVRCILDLRITVITVFVVLSIIFPKVYTTEINRNPIISDSIDFYGGIFSRADWSSSCRIRFDDWNMGICKKEF